MKEKGYFGFIIDRKKWSLRLEYLILSILMILEKKYRSRNDRIDLYDFIRRSSELQNKRISR